MDEAQIELTEAEMRLLMSLFSITTVSDLFRALEAKLDKRDVDKTAQGLVALAGRIRASLDDHEKGNSI